MNAQVLIADDHALFRAGVRELINNAVPDAAILESDSYQHTQEQLEGDNTIYLALVDLCMPGMNGFDSLADLLNVRPEVPFVVLSASTNPDDIRACFDCGVMGYIPKAETAAVIESALKLVLAGGVYVPPLVLNTESRCRTDIILAAQKLTEKQNSVLDCMVKGRSNKEIARELHMSEATVKAHVTGIFKNLNVSNRTQAVLCVNQLRVNQSHVNQRQTLHFAHA